LTIHSYHLIVSRVQTVYFHTYAPHLEHRFSGKGYGKLGWIFPPGSFRRRNAAQLTVKSAGWKTTPFVNIQDKRSSPRILSPTQHCQCTAHLYTWLSVAGSDLEFGKRVIRWSGSEVLQWDPSAKPQWEVCGTSQKLVIC